MHKLIKMDINSISEAIIPVLELQNKVAGAYLFGSVLEKCRPDSDIDLAILLQTDQVLTEQDAEVFSEKLLGKLPHINNHPYDIIILNNVSYILSYKIITQGKLIYARDYDAITSFMEKVSRIRAENYPRYRQALEDIVGR